MNMIKVNYTSTLKDYWEAQHYFRRNRGKKRWVIERFVDVAVIVFGMFMIISKMQIQLGLLFVFFGLCFLFEFGEKSVILLNYYRLGKKKGVETMIFSEQGINYQIASINSQLEWDLFSGYMETPNTFLLIYKRIKNRYAVMPKKNLDKADQEALIKLFEEQINKPTDVEI